MSFNLILLSLALYFFMLLFVGYITGKKANDNGYFVGNKQSIWWMVALGMLSDSMSGVSFISVPGAVNVAHWSYMQVVFGYVAGYFVIAYVLLPLYYKQNLIGERSSFVSYCCRITDLFVWTNGRALFCVGYCDYPFDISLHDERRH